MRRALVVTKGEAILVTDLPPEVTNAPASASIPGGATVPASTASSAHPPESGADLPTLAKMLFKLARENSKFKVIPAVERELIIQA